MRFKQFIISESGGSSSSHGDTGSDWFYGNSLYPSDAYDAPEDFSKPNHFAFLQVRWQKERDEWGRKFYNIDVADTLKKKFTSLASKTMPDPDGGFWKHSENERPNVEINNDAKMQLLGHGKTGKIPSVLHVSNDLLDKTDELNRIFGKFIPSHAELATNFDKPWSPYSGEVVMKKPKAKKYPKHINNF